MDEFVTIMQSFRVRTGGLTRNNKHAETVYVTINLRDFVDRGFYFGMKRKANRIIDYVMSVSPQRLHAVHPFNYGMVI